MNLSFSRENRICHHSMNTPSLGNFSEMPKTPAETGIGITEGLENTFKALIGQVEGTRKAVTQYGPKKIAKAFASISFGQVEAMMRALELDGKSEPLRALARTVDLVGARDQIAENRDTHFLGYEIIAVKDGKIVMKLPQPQDRFDWSQYLKNETTSVRRCEYVEINTYPFNAETVRREFSPTLQLMADPPITRGAVQGRSLDLRMSFLTSDDLAQRGYLTQETTSGFTESKYGINAKTKMAIAQKLAQQGFKVTNDELDSLDSLCNSPNWKTNKNDVNYLSQEMLKLKNEQEAAHNNPNIKDALANVSDLGKLAGISGEKICREKIIWVYEQHFGKTPDGSKRISRDTLLSLLRS